METEVCKNRKRCGGCQLQGLSYEEQLKFKQKELNTLLGEFGRVKSIIPMENPLHYRNKVQSAFYYDYRRKKAVSGVFQSTSKKIVPMSSCMIEDEKCSEIVNTIRKLCDSFKIQPFDRRSGRGFIRHTLIRRGFKSGEIMVVIVSATPVFPSRNNFIKALLKEHADITTIVHNINPYQTELILGERSNILYGKGYIEDELCGMRFRISPDSFYQVNPVQCEKLYNKAIELAGLTGNEKVFDSYCGTGTIGLIASKSAKEILGVELNKSAVKDAIANAKLNGVKNIYFECGDAGKYLIHSNYRPDVLIMDPHRAGSTEEFLRAVLKKSPKKVIYISCNPKTLQRDLKTLTKKYSVKEIQGVDMFPFTKHCEVVVSMSRGGSRL
ncbi:MAG: 23S rRNA (uracil(1939)-C(5))-methyltransferase RlmD [Eubacterium sp.]|nr:23S rRNA (uracil(1939)-C(5))-methyltransferase RlmD [Eubacterium sp.]